MSSVKEQAKEALLGISDEPQLSQQTRAEFMKYAVQDLNSGEKYLDEEQFINAIAPKGEDYVSFISAMCDCRTSADSISLNSTR